MAKTLKQLSNRIRIKYLKKDNKYFLFFGSSHILIKGEYLEGFESIEDAEKFGISLKHVGGESYKY